MGMLGKRLHGYTDNGSGKADARAAISIPALLASRGASLQAPGSKLLAMTKQASTSLSLIPFFLFLTQKTFLKPPCKTKGNRI